MPVVSALIAFLVYAILPIAGLIKAQELDDELEIAVLVAKLAYISTPFFYVNQLFARLSLILLYSRIFSTDTVFRRWLYVLTGIHVSWFITFLFSVLFLCTPVSKWWDILGDQPSFCLDRNAFLVSEETINSSLDFALLSLAVYVVQKVQVKRNVKTKLAFIFAVGGLSGVIGFVKIGIVYNAENDAGQENDTNAFWDILQMTTSIFCACAPMYKSMLPMGTFWTRIKSSTLSLASRTRSYWSLNDINVRSRHTKNPNSTGESKATEGNRSSLSALYIGGTSEADYSWSRSNNNVDLELGAFNPPHIYSKRDNGKIL
ncbi:hypothetical protein B0T17DRAFT_545681 [Bombardia bombarda]|uniref:Rhodopsin domain-containing protein n=1 Tax=Bombardia bombarda TaxID=252184 RepID=A0AA39TJY6_9PEZI|nr:hypothetical protein B0T17DRAFT_545681 [Bombardia bombarda]